MKKVFSWFLVFFIITQLSSSPTKEGGTLVFGKSGDATSLDPSHASDGESYYASSSLYDTLVQLKYGTTLLEPGLATSWDISKDGLEYTFYLRKNIYFSKTKYFNKKSEFTSKDVVFSLKRQFDKKHPYHNIGGVFTYWEAMDMSNIVKDVVALDKYTVKIILKKPEAPLLANLTMDFSMILSSDYANYLLKKNRSNDLGKKPVGTGAFIFKKWIKDDRMIFTANKNYWEVVPHIDKLIFKTIPNSSVRAAELKAGSIHIMDFPNPSEVSNLEKDNNIKIIKQEGLNVGFMAFNTEKKPFDNVLVRRAISHAINMEKIVNAIYEGFGVVATNPIPPTLWSYNNSLKGYKYDVQKAKDLLKKAGYEKGFKTTLWAMPVAREYIPNGRKMAEAIQADLIKVGVDAKIVSYDWGTYLNKSAMGEHDMLLIGWVGDNGDPDNFLNILLSKHSAMMKPSENKSFWKNDEYTKLIDQAKIITNVKNRTKLYMKAQEIFEKDAPWKPLAHSIVVVPVLKMVENFKIFPTGRKTFNKLWLNR